MAGITVAADLLPAAGSVMGFDSKTTAKQEAQEILMHGVATALGYWEEQHALLADRMTEDERTEFRALLQQQADRVAKLFGYDRAWAS